MRFSMIFAYLNKLSTVNQLNVHFKLAYSMLCLI